MVGRLVQSGNKAFHQLAGQQFERAGLAKVIEGSHAPAKW